MDWQSKENSVLCNPCLPLEERTKAQDILRNAPVAQGHIWIATSGSHALAPGQLKWTALSKEGLLASAASVNTFLDCSAQDCWLNPLPPFHVGGLGIWARSYLKGFKVVDLYAQTHGKWEAALFCQSAYDSKATLSSLVPAQVYDLVHQQLRAPPFLRAVIVGGGALHPSLFSQANILGWKLYPSYGLTECASQVATAHPAQPSALKILSHVQAEIDPKGFIRLKSPALLTLYALQTAQGIRYQDPKEEGWFTTEDQGEIHEGYLHMLGRSSHSIKIGGEKVDLLKLEQILEELRLQMKSPIDVALLPMPDERLESVIHLAAASNDRPLIEEMIQQFNQRVMPYEKIRAWHALSHIPRSPLLKVKLSELYQLMKGGL
jgi:O-succinylbenzoic acid--CoA ligase